MQAAVAMPPTRICPSAPMFQNFILNAGARPTAMQSIVIASRVVTHALVLSPRAALMMVP